MFVDWKTLHSKNVNSLNWYTGLTQLILEPQQVFKKKNRQDYSKVYVERQRN